MEYPFGLLLVVGMLEYWTYLKSYISEKKPNADFRDANNTKIKIT
jgi:hypothetical protein